MLVLQGVEWFWEMVEEMTQDQQRQLLRFWTALHTLPAGQSSPDVAVAFVDLLLEDVVTPCQSCMAHAGASVAFLCSLYIGNLAHQLL